MDEGGGAGVIVAATNGTSDNSAPPSVQGPACTGSAGFSQRPWPDKLSPLAFRSPSYRYVSPPASVSESSMTKPFGLPLDWPPVYWGRTTPAPLSMAPL